MHLLHPPQALPFRAKSQPKTPPEAYRYFTRPTLSRSRPALAHGYVEEDGRGENAVQGHFQQHLGVRARPLRIELLQPINQGLSLRRAGTRRLAGWMVPRQLRNACFGEQVADGLGHRLEG
jgi:hypothetical protein